MNTTYYFAALAGLVIMQAFLLFKGESQAKPFCGGVSFGYLWAGFVLWLTNRGEHA